MFQKDEVNNLYVEFGNDLLNKDLGTCFNKASYFNGNDYVPKPTS